VIHLGRIWTVYLGSVLAAVGSYNPPPPIAEDPDQFMRRICSDIYLPADEVIIKEGAGE